MAGRAGVGVGTVYRHFPTRADLVTAVYRHQVDECAALAPKLLEELTSSAAALTRWVDAFVEFLVTKHGLGIALSSEDPSLRNLHTLMLEKLVPACATLIDAGVGAGELIPGITAYTLMRAVGNLCILGADYDPGRRQADGQLPPRWMLRNVLMAKIACPSPSVAIWNIDPYRLRNDVP